MALVFAAITPHPPILIPTIGKDKLEALEKTKTALEQLEQDLYITKPDLIFIISPHTGAFKNTFTINAHTEFESSFDTFGDLVTKKSWKGSPDTGAVISHESHKHDIPVRLISEPKLDHGSAVPLLYLTNHLPDTKVIPIGYSEGNPKDHVSFGEFLSNIIANQEKRIAVIASGDLSHEDKDGGKKLDEKILSILENKNTVGAINLESDNPNIENVCAYRSLLILLGIIKEMEYTFKEYSYEAPFGVGYAVGNFML